MKTERITSHENYVLEDYQRAVAANCFHGSFEEFKDWSKKYCWGIIGNGHSDPPGERGEDGIG